MAHNSTYGVLTQDKKPNPSESIMGGPGGTVSTVDLQKARRAYADYNTEVQTGGGTPVDFETFVKTMWKPENKN